MNTVTSAAAVLLVLVVVGVVAGRARSRFLLLLVGLVVLVVAAAVVSGVTAPRADAAAWTRLLSTAVPLLVAYLAGWLCARGSLFGRLIVLGGAALLLATLPYPALGAAVARLL